MTRVRAARLPVETFRLRPRPRSRRYFRVHVAASLAAMQRTVAKLYQDPGEPVLACVISLRQGTGSLRSCLGLICFARDTLGVGIVAHELCHAAFRALEREGVRVEHWRAAARVDRRGRPQRTDSSEERYCDIVEHLNRSFWAHAYRMGVADPP